MYFELEHMESEIKSGKKVYIRNAGLDEYWLQDRIYENPSVLGLGDLILVSKEKKQSSGGKLDILLKNPEDNSMYEVEVMLGETDPSHIIRTIEYWDLEKRRYPQRQHFAVLVAESFNKRYFNVIQILSLTVPMIAIQADLLEVGSQKVINFTKILDIYEEPADGDEGNLVTEAAWNQRAIWTVESAKTLLGILNEIGHPLKINYTQSYVALVGNVNLYWLSKRSSPKSYLGFIVRNSETVDRIKALLDRAEVQYTYNKYEEFVMYVDNRMLKEHEGIFREIHNMRFPDSSEEVE